MKLNKDLSRAEVDAGPSDFENRALSQKAWGSQGFVDASRQDFGTGFELDRSSWNCLFENNGWNFGREGGWNCGSSGLLTGRFLCPLFSHIGKQWGRVSLCSVEGGERQG